MVRFTTSASCRADAVGLWFFIDSPWTSKSSWRCFLVQTHRRQDSPRLGAMFASFELISRTIVILYHQTNAANVYYTLLATVLSRKYKNRNRVG
jgi:hypothetical protein